MSRTLRYHHPELRDRLAAEYVLGTLQGGARARFCSLMRYDPGLRALVAAWEARLSPLAEATPPREPRPAAWAAIASRLGHDVSLGASPYASPAPGTRVRRASSDGRQVSAAGLRTDLAGWWRGLAISASLSTLVLATLLAGDVLRPAAPPATTAAIEPARYATATPVSDGMMAILTDASARPTMLVSWPLQAGSDGMVELRVRIIMDHPTMDPGSAWELWLLPHGADGAPRSVGLVGIEPEQRLRVDAAMLKALLMAPGMALSNEPAGGSPTGTPTGPVIFRGPCIRA